MASRGWQRERTAQTVDTAGVPVQLTVGLVNNSRGELVAALAVGDSPSAVVTQQTRNRLVPLLDGALADAARMRRDG